MTKPTTETTETTEPEIAQEPRKRAKRTAEPKAPAEPAGDEVVQETPKTPAKAASPRKRAAKPMPATEGSESDAGAAKKPKVAKGSATLREVAERYSAHLEEVGKSEGTCFSYRMELRLALEALGEETPVAKINQADVAGFFGSDRVTRTQSGVEKSPLSVAKTRRVLRQALLFAVSEGLIEKAPLPEKA